MALLEFLNKIVDAFEKDSFVMGKFIAFYRKPSILSIMKFS